MHRPHLHERINEPLPSTLHALVLAGHACVAAQVLLFFTGWLVLGHPPRQFVELLAFHMAGGHFGTMSLGIKDGFPGWFLLTQSILQDLLQMLYAYPLYVRYGYRHLLRWRVIGPWVKQTHEAAMTHHKTIAPYGAIGIFVFVILPSPGSGPVMGSIIGYTLGLGTAVTLLSAGLPIAVLAFVYYFGVDKVSDWNAKAPTFMVYALLIAVALSAAIAATRFAASVWQRGARAFDAADDDSDPSADNTPES